MLDQEKWKRLSDPLYQEEMILLEKAEDLGFITEEEQQRLTYLRKVLDRFFTRFLKYSQITRESFQ